MSSGGAKSSGGAGASTGGKAGAGTGVCGAAKGQLFGSDYPFNQRVDTVPLDAESGKITAYLQTNHTDTQRFRIDGPSDEPGNAYGIVVLQANASTPRQSFTPTDEFYSPDCDPAPMPIPASGATEGESGYACDNDGDCHLIVVDSGACRLYEMWRANRSSASSFEGGCLAIWDLDAPYVPTLRGDCCTSADAAGLPIAAHMFNADEIAAGEIPHAIRFILPNRLMRSRIYVRPATHSTSATTGPADAPPYGARLRLKASFDEARLKPAARVVARALKRYGMILSDGGNLTFTATNDRFTTAKWADVDLAPSDLTSLTWNDFEVPELGTRYTWDNACDCQRSPITN
jgi:serine/threonine-protein kinase